MITEQTATDLEKIAEMLDQRIFELEECQKAGEAPPAELELAALRGLKENAEGITGHP
ncbi:MAG: hypothetical protein AAFY35_04235 [Pseudomonadota bacterium]